MPAKKKIRVFYRAPTHVPLWKVMEAGGFLARHGLDIELGSLEGKRGRATEGLLTGELDVVSGNHHSLYARRALHGEPFVHIAQVNVQWNQRWMVAGEGVGGIQDLRGKRVCVNKRNGHPGLNVWLYLRLHGLHDGRDVELAEGDNNGLERTQRVLRGEYAATFLGPVERLRAEAAGARVIELPTMAMIEGVTLTTTTGYVHHHPDEVTALLHALIDGIHFFRTRPTDTLAIIKAHCRDTLRLRSDDELEHFYRYQAEVSQPKPYPTSEAIQNVFALAVKETPAIKEFNPLVMWDLHHLRAIDDSGYIDKLYR